MTAAERSFAEVMESEFRQAMGHFATGVTVVTSIREDGEPVGTTASAVSSLSLRPPLVLVCFDRDSLTLRAIRAHGAFAVNVLAAPQQHLSANFARRGLAAAWDGVRHRPGPTGSPRLDGVLAAVECTVERSVRGGDHEIVVGRVHDAEVSYDGAAPLLYWRGSYLSLGGANVGPANASTGRAQQLRSRRAGDGMSLHFHWFLPTNGDGRDIVAGGHGVATGSAGAIRPASLGYLGQVARSAEQLGFEAALTPTGAWCEDAWLATGMLTEVTERLKFLVAFRPGLISPLLAAQMAATFQRYSRGRLLLNVVTGGESAEQRAYGDFLGKAQRYQRCAEFLDIVKRLWGGETVSHDGEYVRLEGARLARRPDPVPPLYFGGTSAEAGPVAGRYSDVYLTWGEPPAAVDAKLRWMDGLARQAGRTLRYGIRLHVVTRDTAHEAWLQANRLIDGIDEAMIAAVQDGLARSESEGQRRMRDLHGGSPGNLEVSPNLWAGVGLLRGGAGTALVGSHAEVADRIEEYADLGISEFILSGYPHLEEAYWFGEGVLPILRRRGRWQHPAPGSADESVTMAPFAPAPGPGQTAAVS